MEIRRTKILGRALLLAGLALCGVGLWLLSRPAQYQATVRIKVEPDMMDMGGNGQVMSYDPYFIQTEFEVIQSQVILSRVIGALNLDVEWGKKYAGGATLTTNEAIAILKWHLNLTPVRNTKLIKISFSSEDPEEAARIANAIAEAYQTFRLERRNQMTQEGIKVLSEQFQQDDQDIKTRQENLEQLGKQLNLPNPEPAAEVLKTNYPSYFQAKQELQKKMDFHKILAAKIESEKLNLLIPQTSLVLITDPAQPPTSPVSPNRPLGAALLAIGLLSTAGGFLLLKSSRRRSCSAS
jgi:uncharacterized protein involved in exopolysaccharide biosynthesis